MKKILLSIFALVLIITSQIQAQAPQSFQYQAIARDNNGLPIMNQAVRLRISIISNSPTGAIQYVETHSKTTNQLGLFTLAIGQGTINNGAFNTINWGSNNHYIKVELDETGGTAYQDMGIVQLLSVPYALHSGTTGNINDADADPNNELQNLSINGQILSISNGNSVTLPSGGTGGGGTLDAAYNFGGAGVGRNITANSGEVNITTNSTNALRTSNSNMGTALLSTTTNSANTSSPIQANTNSNSNLVAGVIGNSTGGAWGLAGQIQTSASGQAAVYGSNLRTSGGYGVLGVGFNGTVGQTGQSQGFAVFGENFDNIGTLGNGIGVAGKGYYGVLGEDRYYGGQSGAYGVYSNGSLGATGVKTFRIDHPKDPENKFLRHFSMESNEVLNIYRGTVSFDNNGEATVELPDYFNDINKNTSYQLTPVGAYMPLYIKEKVGDNNQFVIAGGLAGKEVSWAVYAERNDLYMQKNPDQGKAELEKRPQEKGLYLIPSLYGFGQDKALFGQQPAKVEQVPLNITE